jgi:hydrogenase maturation protein HypF
VRGYGRAFVDRSIVVGAPRISYSPGMERVLIEVRGTVQGVGFRPHVYSLATALGLHGFAQNRGSHLFIDLEGDAAGIRTFVHRLTLSPPARAVIDAVDCRPAPPAWRSGFCIEASDTATDHDVRIAPDVAICDECLAELFDPQNRRYRYPFITCSHCGPRFTIVTDLPYDRDRTTMRGFAMCPACRREYGNPADRRFHAQPIACRDCGPSLTAIEGDAIVRGDEAALGRANAALAAGRIVAVKGLGGYHLACDATNTNAVTTLRARKRRDAKPFAVMIGDEQAQSLRGDRQAWTLLTSPERPIVVVDRGLVSAAGLAIAAEVAPGCPAVGLMLPYTPLHHLLMRAIARPLVMTSGNLADEPIVFDDDEARARLGGIADVILAHDRPIHARCDDSIVRVVGNAATPIRRARGLAPSALTVASRAEQPILATGGHVKNTFCIHAGTRAWLSHHVGDLENAVAYAELGRTVDLATRLLDIRPSLVAHDLHPDYLSTRFAQEYPALQRIAVQHHHAHVLSCAAEHGVVDPVLGVAFDGSGLGTDGTIWGGEFLLVERGTFTRLAHLACVTLAGGEAAVREPWRTAVAHLVAAGREDLLDPIAGRIGAPRFDAVRQMIARGVGSPSTSSAGRLFDAVAAIVGVRDRAAFEGQAAMALEALAGDADARPYRFAVDSSCSPWIVDPAPVVVAVSEDTTASRDRQAIAAGFHDAVAHMIAEVAEALASQGGVRRIALTGGVFQNARLTRCTEALLKRRGLSPLVHRRVPCNDGGLSLGQAIAAAYSTCA